MAGINVYTCWLENDIICMHRLVEERDRRRSVHSRVGFLNFGVENGSLILRGNGGDQPVSGGNRLSVQITGLPVEFDC
jgi:hypothetical protein